MQAAAPRASPFPENRPIIQSRVQSPSAVWTPRIESARAQHVRSALALLFGPPELRSFNVRLWNGASEGPRFPRTSSFTLVLRRPESLARMLMPPSDARLADAYLRNDVDVEGDIESAVGIRGMAAERAESLAVLSRLAFHLVASAVEWRFGRPRLHVERGFGPVGRSHEEIRDSAGSRLHRDLGSDFYTLWLDRLMAHSVAHFETGAESLHDAQFERLDQVCRSLRLGAGDRLLDLGCGWGALLVHAAGRYGVEAVGVTASETQAAFARRRIAEAGFADRVRVVRQEHAAPSTLGTFDRIASVGTLEQVGDGRPLLHLEHVAGLLRPGGSFLGHRIVALDGSSPRGPRHHVPDRLWPSSGFMRHQAIMDGRIPRLSELVRASEAAGFEIDDTEGLREDFTVTLRHWRRRLEQHHARAAASIGEAAYRMWRLHLAALAHEFDSGRLGIAEMRLEKPAVGAGGRPGNLSGFLPMRGRGGDVDSPLHSQNGHLWMEPSSGTPTDGRAVEFDNIAQVVRSLDTTEAPANRSA